MPGGEGVAPLYTLTHNVVFLFTFKYFCLPSTTYTYTVFFLYTFSHNVCRGVVMYGDVGKVGKRIPLTTLWLGVVKGIQVVDTVRQGGMV